MNNILVIVYSYTGTSRRVAELLCSQQNWQLASVTEASPRSGVPGTWRCIFDSFFRRQPAIHYDGPPPSDFDAVVLVSPIWMLQLTGPMRSFVARHVTSATRPSWSPTLTQWPTLNGFSL